MNLSKIQADLDEAWQAACDVDHGDFVADGDRSLLAVAIQDLVLAIREMIDPEKSP